MSIIEGQVAVQVRDADGYQTNIYFDSVFRRTVRWRRESRRGRRGRRRTRSTWGEVVG